MKQQLNDLDKLDLPDERWKFFALLTVAKGALAKEDVKKLTGMRDRTFGGSASPHSLRSPLAERL